LFCPFLHFAAFTGLGFDPPPEFLPPDEPPPLETCPVPRSRVMVLCRSGFVSAVRTIVAVPVPKPEGTVDVPPVLGAEPLADWVCAPLLKVIWYLKPSPAVIAT